MKPTHQSRDLLILKESPWIVASLIAVLVLAFLVLSVALLGPTLRGEVKPDKQLIAWLVLSFIFLVGVAMPVIVGAMLLEFTQVRFDRIGQFVEIRRRKLYRFHTRRIPLKDIKDAYPELLWDVEEEDIDGTVHRTTAKICRPVLRMRGRYEELPLIQAYSNTSAFGALVDTINNWLEQS